MKISSQMLKNFESKWGLSDLTPIATSTNNKVFSGLQGDLPIILKLNPKLAQETAALKAFEGYGAIQILRCESGALLLEKVESSLKSYFPTRDEEAIQITSRLIKNLHQAPLPTSRFPHIQDWLQKLDQNWDIPIHFLEKARQLRNQLLASPTKDVLLHADLHHDNILQHNHDWIAIDPHGVIGDPTYEVGAFIRNPIPDLMNCPDIILTRIEGFSRILDFDPKRIQDWCFVQAVLAWIWALEDEVNTDYFEWLTTLHFRS